MLGDGALEEARRGATMALAARDIAAADCCGVRPFERSGPSLKDLLRAMTLSSLSESHVILGDFCWRDDERLLAERDRSAWPDDLVAWVLANSRVGLSLP